MQVYTSDELVQSVKDAISAPGTGILGVDNATILKALNQALLPKMASEVIKLREEYYVVTVRIAIVGGTSRYRIPDRAMFQKLRNIFFVGSTGDLEKIEPQMTEDRDLVSGGSFGEGKRYYLEGNDIVLIPPVGSGSSGSLEISFFFRPGDLVLVANARQVTAVNLGARTATLAGSTLPSTFVVNAKLDVHSAFSGAEIKTWDNVINAPAGQVITFNTEIDGSVPGTKPVQIGDWVCLAGEAAVPGLPKELHPLLIDVAALRLLKAFGDQANLKSQATILKEDMEGVKETMETRVEGKPMLIRGRKGLLRAGRF